MNVIIYGVYDNSGFYKNGTNGWVYTSNMIEGARKSIYAMSRAELADIEKEIKLLVNEPGLAKETRRSLRACYELAKLRRVCEDTYERMYQRAEVAKPDIVVFKDLEVKALQCMRTIDDHYKNNCNNVI